MAKPAVVDGGVERSPAARLSALDRLLPVWISLAIALGILLGRIVPGVGALLDAIQIAGVSLPIAVGLFWMMYPLLAKVRYGKLAAALRGERIGR